MIKKITTKIVFLSLWLGLTQGAFADNRFGIRVSPALNFKSISPSKYKNKSLLGFSAGAFYDMEFSEEKYITLGLLFNYDGYKLEDQDKINNKSYQPDVFDANYLLIPLWIKFYTAEIATDSQVYVYVGALFGIKINETKPTQDHSTVFAPFKGDFILGLGYEYELTLHTSIFADLAYSLDVHNVLSGDKRKDSDALHDLVSTKTHSLIFTIGIRF